MISVISYFSTKFGELWDKSLEDLITGALEGVLTKSQLDKEEVDAVFFGNMLGGVVEKNLLLSAQISESLQVNVPVYRLEAACASGGMAFESAVTYLKANPDSTVIVLGAEKMTDVDAHIITEALASAASVEEQNVGLTFPGVYGMMAQAYLQEYNYSEEHLAAISVKNHAHAVYNENAHFRRLVTIDNVLESPYVAYPLKVLDSSAISDGAAALILSNKKELVNKFPSATVLAAQIATDTISISKRESLTELKSTQIAGDKAFKEAGISHSEINVMEVHDCFSIAEIFALEDLGFWEKGSGGKRAQGMETSLKSGNNLIVNTSGGLKAAGHPVGSTGIKQIGEVYLQLTQQAGERQVKHAQRGLAHNVGGSGGVAIVSILGV